MPKQILHKGIADSLRKMNVRLPRVPARLMGVHLVTWVVVCLVVFLPVLMSNPTAQGIGRLPADVQIAGIDVSKMKPSEAVRFASPAVVALGEKQFTVHILGEEHTFTAADIGLVFDAVQTIQAIERSGESGDYPLIAQFDPQQFQTHLNQIDSMIQNPAVDASVEIRDGKAVVTPGSVGQTFQLSQYRADILEQANQENPRIELQSIVGEPNISTEEAEATASQVNLMLEEPLVFSVEGGAWEVAPADYASAVIIAPDGKGGLAINWDLDKLQPSLDPIIAEIESTETTDAWVQDLGTHSWLVPDQSGMTVDRKGLLETTHATLQLGEHRIAVPVSLTAAGKTDDDLMAELGITKVIASGDSVYTGSGAGRAHNVETAAFYIDRTLVAPGGSYSFNDSVGSLFNGEYMSAGSYIDGPNGESIAGGVCQVSTTVFRAALNAGFPIEERWPHSYRSPFYELGGWEPGFDAAIVQDSIIPQDSTDMRFANPTDSWLMITATTDGDRLVVDIWGEETGYKVKYSESDTWIAHAAPDALTVMVDAQLPNGTMEWQDPLQGLGVWYTRTVTDAEGNVVREDDWQTVYYATGPIVRVSPDMEDEAYAKSGS